MTDMSTHFTIFLAGILVLTFIWLRMEVVYAARYKELNRARHEADALAMAGKDWRPAYEPFDKGPGAEAQMPDLAKWTHAQFYPRPTTESNK